MSDLSHLWKVYVHVSKLDGRMYCGITSQTLIDRWEYGNGYKGCIHFNNAIKKYGWDSFDHIVLMPAGTKAEAEELEETIIRCCHLQDERYGFNISDGGYSGTGISEEGKARLHDAFYRSASPMAKKLVMFDYDGKRIKTFGCLTDCADFLGIKIASLYNYIKPGSKPFRKKYFIRYYEDVHDVETLPDHKELIDKYQYRLYAKKVNQYSLDGKFIKTYKSIISASEETGTMRSEISSVASAASKNNYGKKSAGGFQWRYFNGDTSDIEPFRFKTAIAVSQIDAVTQRIINSFSTIADASRATGISYSVINHAVHSKSHIGKGFLWKVLNQSDSLPGE